MSARGSRPGVLGLGPRPLRLLLLLRLVAGRWGPAGAGGAPGGEAGRGEAAPAFALGVLGGGAGDADGSGSWGRCRQIGECRAAGSQAGGVAAKRSGGAGCRERVGVGRRGRREIRGRGVAGGGRRRGGERGGGGAQGAQRGQGVRGGRGRGRVGERDQGGEGGCRQVRGRGAAAVGRGRGRVRERDHGGGGGQVRGRGGRERGAQRQRFSPRSGRSEVAAVSSWPRGSLLRPRRPGTRGEAAWTPPQLRGPGRRHPAGRPRAGAGPAGLRLRVGTLGSLGPRGERPASPAPPSAGRRWPFSLQAGAGIEGTEENAQWASLPRALGNVRVAPLSVLGRNATISGAAVTGEGESRSSQQKFSLRG
ncbi:hypothetical protein VULLAG_LOCUS1754 [Vulpes lagopus]